MYARVLASRRLVVSGTLTRRAGSTRRISDGYEGLSCVDTTVPCSKLVDLVSALDFLCDLGAMLTSVSVVSSAAVTDVSSETCD